MRRGGGVLFSSEICEKVTDGAKRFLTCSPQGGSPLNYLHHGKLFFVVVVCDLARKGPPPPHPTTFTFIKSYPSDAGDCSVKAELQESNDGQNNHLCFCHTAPCVAICFCPQEGRLNQQKGRAA